MTLLLVVPKLAYLQEAPGEFGGLYNDKSNLPFLPRVWHLHSTRGNQ